MDKNFQQFTIIKILRLVHMVRQMTEFTRNVRLTSTTRSNAGIIYKTLKSAKSKLKTHTIGNINAEAMKSLSTGPFEPVYFEIVDGNTLQPIHDASKHDYIVACTAVWADGVRLIDNHILKS
ncbi:MAG: pantoate--beta-alanine ligase [Chitinophagales bacterium]|nr:pantoate--beta-alanine ligase [Chitinophagales bacterium]